MPTQNVPRCQATNQAGKPCSAQHWRDGWCRWHHPDLDEQRRDWARKGGANRANRVRAKKQLPDAVLMPIELEGLLSQAIKDVLRGALDPGPANAAANLAKSLVTIREATEVDRRLTALEQAAGIGERRVG